MTDLTSRRLGAFAFYGIAGAILTFLILPSLLVVPMSFSATTFLRFPPSGFSLRWYEAYFSDPGWVDATLFSLQIALMTTVTSAVIGTMAAFSLVRGSLPAKDLISALLLAPLIVPHVIVAIAVYFQFAPLGLVGTRLGFVLIHTALAVPYVVLVVSAALQRVPPSLEMAGLNLGATRLRCFQAITLPLIAPSIAAGAVFAFLASFDETVVSFFISNLDNRSLPRKMFEDIDYNISPTLAAVATMLTALTLLALVLGHFLKRRSDRT